MKLEFKDKIDHVMYVNAKSTYGIKEVDYQALKEAGFSGVFINGNLAKETELCEKYDMDLYIQGYYNAYIYGIDYIKNLKNLPYFHRIKGAMCLDEPHYITSSKFDTKTIYDAFATAGLLSKIYPEWELYITPFSNYAKEIQLLYGTDNSKYPIVSKENHENYVKTVNSVNSNIMIGEHYGNIHTGAFMDNWIDELFTHYNIQKYYKSIDNKKELWQYIKCVSGKNKNIADITSGKSIKFALILNILFGCTKIHWFRYGKGISDYYYALFNYGGSKTPLYDEVKILLNGSIKNIGSLFKNATIKNIRVFNKPTSNVDILDGTHIKELYSGEIIVNNFEKENIKYTAIFAFKDSKLRLYSNCRTIIDENLEIITLKPKIKNEFELKQGDLLILKEN